MGSGSTTRNMCCRGRSHQGHLGSQPRHSSAWALWSPELPVGFQLPCEGQPVVTDTVRLQSAPRCLSVRSRLNIVNVPSLEACKLRSSGGHLLFAKLFANGHLPFPGCREGGGSSGATMLCKSPSGSAWSPVSSPDPAVQLHLLGHGRVCSVENWIKKPLVLCSLWPPMRKDKEPGSTDGGLQACGRGRPAPPHQTPQSCLCEGY